MIATNAYVALSVPCAKWIRTLLVKLRRHWGFFSTLLLLVFSLLPIGVTTADRH